MRGAREAAAAKRYRQGRWFFLVWAVVFFGIYAARRIPLDGLLFLFFVFLAWRDHRRWESLR